MNPYRLQPAAAEHQDAIKALIRTVRINPLGLDWRRFVVALDAQGQLVGCGQIKPHRDGSRELASIAVVPAWRGRGVARAIMLDLLGRHPAPVWLTCMSPLVPFYARIGFREQRDPAQMPPYFRRVIRLIRFVSRQAPGRPYLAVMVRDAA